MGYYLGGGLIGVDYKLKDSMQMHTGQIRGNLKLMIERERTWITLETAKFDGDVSLTKEEKAKVPTVLDITSFVKRLTEYIDSYGLE